MSSALDETNVLEIDANLGSAYAAMLLAEQGANVLRIEQPGGCAWRSTPHYHVLNRSKESIALDFASANSRERLAELVRAADIVVTGFGPARLRALGLDYESIKKINPRAIALQVPSLGGRGPDADFEANEDLVAARGGIAGSQWARSGNPVPLVFPAASYSAGTMASIGAVSALIARGQDGLGQLVESSILAGAFSLQTGAIMRHDKMTSVYQGASDPLGPIPVYRLFEASDGKFLFAACGNSTFWGKFAIAIERPDLVADPRFEGAPWGVPVEHWQPLKDIIEPIIKTRPRDEWLRILREADVPNAPVMTRQEFIDYAQVRALGMRREVDDPALGRTVQLGLPVFLGDTPGVIKNAAKAPGADTAARERWLNGARRTKGVARAKSSSKAPLDGVVVLDFASYIAGSYGPMILSQLGATVIKIESLEGDSFRHFGFGFMGWNQGKRGLAVDITSPEGREIIHGLARKADVVVENLRPGRLKRFGYDYESLAAINPRIIYMSVNAFGNRGPEHNQPGFDPLLQARSGVMAAQGGHHAHPVYLTCAICDYGAAMLSAYGCVLALRARGRTGRGQFCETSLLQSAMAFQAGEFIFYDGRPDMENGDPERRGHSALARAYRCADGEWIFVSIEEASQWSALNECFTDVPALNFDTAAAEPAEGKLAAALAEVFSKLARSAAFAQLTYASVPVSLVQRAKDLFDDRQVLANELIAAVDHPDWGRVRQTGALIRFESTPVKIERAAPLLGQHTDEILREFLGYDDAKLTVLRSRRVIK
jgi:crotonobetainyl-CoA:carnitine CoA-transferase CaiB-like acyl-CoA transferase